MGSIETWVDELIRRYVRDGLLDGTPPRAFRQQLLTDVQSLIASHGEAVWKHREGLSKAKRV